MAKILIFANNDVGLYKFRKELIEELLNDNEVYISLPNGEYIPKLIQLGCKYINTPINRRGTNPLTDFNLFLNYRRIIRTIKPDCVLTYTIKPNVYGGLACRLSKVPYIVNITGLGTAVENDGLIQRVTIGLYKFGLKKASCVYFQNESNRRFFIKTRVVQNNSRLIPGSGVNLKQHPFEDYPDEDKIIRFLFIGRIMKAKGIDELLEAAKIVKEKYPNAEFELLGGSEEDYNNLLTEYERSGLIRYHGHQEDVHSFIKKAHAIILPSYHEGTANVLLESASSGRPVLASRVPGCMETFDENVSGFGFEVRNVDNLVESIIQFINLPYEQKKNMGMAGRLKMEKEYDRDMVVKSYIHEINRIYHKK